jgi:hypothetical protein
MKINRVSPIFEETKDNNVKESDEVVNCRSRFDETILEEVQFRF